MAQEHVGQTELTEFAAKKVNLPKDEADVYRAQVRRLSDKLRAYLADHPDFSLRRLILSGSLAKGTALRALNDVDVAAYVSGATAPREIQELLPYLADRLTTAFPNFKPDQVVVQRYSVRVSFRATGLDVDIVPILFDGDPEGRGLLVSQEDGSFLMTSIDQHLSFVRRRKKTQPTHFAQVIRLLKYWARNAKLENPQFRCKSFLIELLVARLLDRGEDLSNYPEGPQAFFTHIATSGLEERVVFPDYYRVDAVPPLSKPVQVIDPVNPENNVARLYTRGDQTALVECATDAGDAIDAALRAPTKTQTIGYWQRVFGSSFQG